LDPTYELTAAVIARLRTDTGVSALVGTRVYDRPPDGAITPPYASMGPSNATTDDADCIDGLEVTMQIDCWSWGSDEAFSSTQVRKLAGAIRSSLHEAEFELTDNALASIRHRITRYQRESDGVTNRAIISITAFVEIP
jgi:hypothetical protein